MRGLHDPNKRKAIKSVMRKKSDLICLQETKLSEMFVQVVRNLGMGRNLERAKGVMYWC